MPITAGIFMFLASMAVWEFDEPCAVTNARTLSLSSATVSLGARSSAQTIMLSQDSAELSAVPVRLAIMRLEISRTSAERACMYASSIAANISAKLSEVTATAYSALTCWVSMMFAMDSL